MSTKSQEIIAKLRQRKEDAASITEVWHGLFPGWALGATQAMTWLVQGYDIDQIIVGLEAAHIQRSKRDTAAAETGKGAKPMTANEAVAYASGVMRNVHFASLPEEQKEHLSKVRSEAGKRGAAARWNGKKDLPSGCQTLPPSYTGSGSGSPSSSNSSAFAFSAAGAPEPKATATPKAPDFEKGEEPEPKPEQPTPVLGLEPESKTKAKPENQNPVKTRLVKSGTRKGQPYPPDFDSWAMNAWRIDWLEGRRDDNGELLPITLEDEPDGVRVIESKGGIRHWALGEEPRPTPVPPTPPKFTSSPNRKDVCGTCGKWGGKHKPDCSRHPDNLAAAATERKKRMMEQDAKRAAQRYNSPLRKQIEEGLS